MDGVFLRPKTTIDGRIDVSFANSPRNRASQFSTDMSLLNLDSDLAEDDESWLYGCQSPTISNATSPVSSPPSDVVSWLRNAADKLDPKQRRTLCHKLDSIAAKLNPDPSNLVDIKPNILRRTSSASDDYEFFDAISDLKPVESSMLVVEEASHSSTPTKMTPMLSPKPVATMTVDRKLLMSKSPLKPSGSPLVVDTLPSSTVKTHPNLNPGLHNIQRLAEMQEEDLRQELDRIQRARQRRVSQTSDGGATSSSDKSPRSLAGDLGRMPALAAVVDRNRAPPCKVRPTPIHVLPSRSGSNVDRSRHYSSSLETVHCASTNSPSVGVDGLFEHANRNSDAFSPEKVLSPSRASTSSTFRLPVRPNTSSDHRPIADPTRQNRPPVNAGNTWNEECF